MSRESTDQIKSDLRLKYREARRGIADVLRLVHDQTINAQIEAFTSKHQASRIAGYLAFDGEPDISTALAHINNRSVEVNLPVICARPVSSTDDCEPALIFRRWLPRMPNTNQASFMKKNSLGIEEPVIGAEVAAADLDVIFLPLVAWDESGGRLGMGAGYYDRALADVENTKQPLRIGVAYQAQCATALPMTEYDVRLHGIITEKGLVTFNE